jgi:hypothetical protein
VKNGESRWGVRQVKETAREQPRSEQYDQDPIKDTLKHEATFAGEDRNRLSR